jgi:hypothetical protein
MKYGPTPLKASLYLKRSQAEQYRCDKLARKFKEQFELENYIVASMIKGERKMWILNFTDDCDDVYQEWLGRTQSLQYMLTSQVRRLLEDHDSFNAMFDTKTGQHPPVLKALHRKDLTLESFVLLDMCTGFVSRIDSKLPDDPVWIHVRERANKYRPFIERLVADVRPFKQMLIKTVQDQQVVLPSDK